MLGRGFLVGAMVGAGAMLLVPGVAAAVARAGRPVLRAALKTGATAYKEFSEAGAEAFEHFEDMVAEVRAEMATEASDEPAAAGSSDSVVPMTAEAVKTDGQG